MSLLQVESSGFLIIRGAFRKWYGNNELIVNWRNAGEDIINNGMNSFRGRTFIFKKDLHGHLQDQINLLYDISQRIHF